MIKHIEITENAISVPESLVPYCQFCGKPVTLNLRIDSTFLETSDFRKHVALFNSFIEKHKLARVLFLELGVGLNTPAIIKYQFQNFTRKNPNAFYATVNLESEKIPIDIRERSVSIERDAGSVIETLLNL